MKSARIVRVVGEMVLLGVLLGLLLPAATATEAAADRSMEHCIERLAPEWGACGNADGVEIELRNTCAEPVRVHWCVSQKNGWPQCGVHPSLPPNAVSQARACESPRPPELRFEACAPGDRCRVRTSP